MPWVNDIQFNYTTGILRDIATCYDHIYEWLIIGDHQITNLFSIAEFKADFDIALNELGRGKWQGLSNTNFKYYRGWSRKQRIIIAYILGIRTDRELQAWGFWDARKYRYKVFLEMLSILNQGKS